MFFRLLYNLAIFILSPVLVAIFLCYRRGRIRWPERFGFWSQLPASKNYIWIHAASAGEVGGVLPIAKKLKHSNSSLQLLLTCTSPTGLDRAGELFDYKNLIPFDCLFFLKNALRQSLPKILIISETDLWPELIHFLSGRGVKIIVINSRVSSTYLRSFEYMSPWLSPALAKVKKFFCQDALTQDRLKLMGVLPEQLCVVGNSKFDDLECFVQGARPELHYKLRRPVIVLGSLRPGEEKYWMAAFREFAEVLDFVIVPRHLEFVPELVKRLVSANLSYRLWSQYKCETAPDCSGDPLVVDAIGELIKFYSICSLAFIGGTLCDGYGGHNPLEPVAFDVPIMIGPYNANQEGMYHELLCAEAVISVKTQQEIRESLQLLVTLGDKAFLPERKAASAYLHTQLGASEILAKEIIAEVV